MIAVDIYLHLQCTALACPLSCHMAAVGTASGDLCVLSLTDPTSPKMVAEMHIHHSPVRAIRSVATYHVWGYSHAVSTIGVP